MTSKITVKRPDPETVADFKLTREERAAVFRGTLRVLRRAEKPDQEAGAEVIVSQTRGGKQIVDRNTGEVIDVPRQPRLWIVVKGWHLRAGETEWETDVAIHDQREHNRVLSSGALGGIPREAGLKTRWGKKVVHKGGEVEVVDKRVPTKEEQHENWTTETERGYGGRNGMERSADGDLVPATGVDDATLDDFSRRVAEENQLRRNQKHFTAEQFREERLVAANYRKGNRSGGNAAKRRGERAVRRLEKVGL